MSQYKFLSPNPTPKFYLTTRIKLHFKHPFKLMDNLFSKIIVFIVVNFFFAILVTLFGGGFSNSKQFGKDVVKMWVGLMIIMILFLIVKNSFYSDNF